MIEPVYIQLKLCSKHGQPKPSYTLKLIKRRLGRLLSLKNCIKLIENSDETQLFCKQQHVSYEVNPHTENKKMQQQMRDGSLCNPFYHLLHHTSQVEVTSCKRICILSATASSGSEECHELPLPTLYVSKCTSCGVCECVRVCVCVCVRACVCACVERSKLFKDYKIT